MRKNRKDGFWIYRKSITTRSGKTIYAWQYGKRAFKIWVTTDK